MKILHITPSIGPGSYGLGQVALNLAKAQLELSNSVFIWCLDPPDVARAVEEEYGFPAGTIVSFPVIGPHRLGLSLQMIRAAIAKGGDFEVVHQHGIWSAISLATKNIAARHRVPTIIAPHGSLEPSVLRKSFVKKRIASLLYENANLFGAACLHATSPKEIDDFRSYGLKNPIALIKNGSSSNWLDSNGNGDRFRQKYQLPRDRKILLYMSRIAPKKGIPILLDAWSHLGDVSSEWILVIIGGDENGHKSEVLEICKRLNLDQNVRFLDPVYGSDKRDAFSAASVFILPSLSEGFPMVVLDSLGAGVPAIVSQASAWEELEINNCGWWIAANSKGIEQALRDSMSKSPEELEKMGKNGKRYVADNYNWKNIAAQACEVYNWLLGVCESPGCVSSGK